MKIRFIDRKTGETINADTYTLNSRWLVIDQNGEVIELVEDTWNDISASYPANVDYEICEEDTQ